jgi:hypothetical protein
MVRRHLRAKSESVASWGGAEANRVRIDRQVERRVKTRQRRGGRPGIRRARLLWIGARGVVGQAVAKIPLNGQRVRIRCDCGGSGKATAALDQAAAGRKIRFALARTRAVVADGPASETKKSALAVAVTVMLMDCFMSTVTRVNVGNSPSVCTSPASGAPETVNDAPALDGESLTSFAVPLDGES